MSGRHVTRIALVSMLAGLTVLLQSPAPPGKAMPPGDAANRRALMPPAALGTADDPDAQSEMEFMMLRDPLTNAIPRDIRRRETAFARLLPVQEARLFQDRATGAVTVQSLTWTERGPNNVGGRTRVFAVDVANATTLLAGSVAGGMWRSTDDGASWSLRTAPAQIHSTTCIAQDRRTGHTGTWYVGTGEIRGSTTNATRWGSLYLGDGIFKSTDDGLSWVLLASTSSGTPQTTDPFDYVINVATNPANLAQDEVLAATYVGIYRSIDGGSSWTKALASDSGFTDVAIAGNGAMYAVTRLAGAIGIWRSPDGASWTRIQPATFPTVANRVVFGLVPSNPNALYLFVQGANSAPAIAGHQLWKYNYLSGDGSGAGGTWVNRAGSLPADINTQAGYDQVVHVKPDDENFVIIGGTNLYRSTNGFADATQTTVIGGYDFYPAGNHHPDLHAGGFNPANAGVYYSAGDGGISKAADITLPSMLWTSLDHGYNVTQCYSVSIAPDAGNNMILAGAQDNGSQLGNAPGASDWLLAYGGDGTVVAISAAADHQLYTQYQGGQIQRQNWDGTNLVDFTPSGGMNQLFVNPIVLDPNAPSRLYYAAGTSLSSSMIWRADSAPTANPVTGWTSLPGTDVGAGAGYTRNISAIGIATANPADVLYYGTNDGLVMKVTSASSATPAVTNVTPPGLAGGTIQGGFVRCVAVDPTNSNRALVAFGNYNFRSLWYTTDGGLNWTDVEGNLAGAAGPSIRWATIFDLDGQLEVFLGTSIGVLSTQVLAGASTVWAQEAVNEIGNVIVGYMAYRPSDRTLAVATHARGVFTTQFAPVLDAGGQSESGSLAMLGPGVPNPAGASAGISYSLPRAGEASLVLIDVAGRRVATLVSGYVSAGRHDVSIDTHRFANGAYYAVLRAAGRVETRTLVVRR
jgi:hypothetical protein